MRRAALAGALGLLMTACAAGPEGGGGAESAPLRVAVVGDSLSVGFAPDFTAEALDQSSYLYWVVGAGSRGDDAPAGPGATLAGGTAVPGATSLHQLERAVPVEADVLILALGTNDLAWGIPFGETADALGMIAATVGAPRVLLLSIPPLEPEIDPTTAVYNRQLRRLADERGWEWVDAAAAVRDGGGWAAGMTNDGVHYTRAGARVVGQAVAGALHGAS